MDITEKNGLKINTKLLDFVNNEIIPDINIKSEEFWASFGKIVHELAPINMKLIQKREEIQKKIDEWHKKNKGKDLNKKEYLDFLKSISYIVEEKDKFNIETTNVDDEIAKIAGPQLVVPVDNARYALNAANARWGSLYDALYGTDVIPGKKGKDFDEQRAQTVIAYVRNFLDKVTLIPSFFIASIEDKTSSDLNKFLALETPFANDANKTHLILILLSPLTPIFFLKGVIFFLITM